MATLDDAELGRIFDQHDETGLARLIAELDQRPWDAETLRLGRAIAAYEDQRGWLERAQKRFQNLLACALADQPDSATASAAASADAAELYLDLAELAERWNEPMLGLLEKSQPLARQSGDWALQARQARLNGQFACLTGSLDAAQSALEKALALYQEHQDDVGIVQAKLGLARVEIQRQRYPEALELIRSGMHQPRVSRTDRLHAELMMTFGRVLRCMYPEQGSAQAINFYRGAAQIHDRHRDPLGYAQACAGLAEMQAGLERPDEALETLRLGLARLFEAHRLDRGGALFDLYAGLCARLGTGPLGLGPECLEPLRPYVQRWLDDFTHLAADPDTPASRVDQYARSFFEVAKVLDEPAGQAVLTRMLAFFSQEGSAHPGAAAWIYAPLLEKGVDALPLLDPLAAGLEAHFPFLLDFLQVCRNLQTDWIIHNPEAAHEKLSFFIPAAGPQMPAIQQVGPAARGLARSLGEAAGRSLAVRQLLRQRPDFLTRLEPVAYLYPELETLAEILRVLDEEELLVLRPAMRRGYRVRFSGVTDIYQLHTLLAATLIGDPVEGWLTGAPPDPRVAAAAGSGPVPPTLPPAEGSFNLLSWRALLPGGGLSDDVDTWVWNEGKPADIPTFKGLRVLLLAPPPYERTWNAGRRYPMLRADLQVIEKLTPRQVDEWMARILVGEEG